jgi:hypothetical protein
MSWGQLFAVMETATKLYRVEDYTINAGSLEDAFLALTTPKA